MTCQRWMAIPSSTVKTGTFRRSTLLCATLRPTKRSRPSVSKTSITRRRSCSTSSRSRVTGGSPTSPGSGRAARRKHCADYTAIERRQAPVPEPAYCATALPDWLLHREYLYVNDPTGGEPCVFCLIPPNFTSLNSRVRAGYVLFISRRQRSNRQAFAADGRGRLRATHSLRVSPLRAVLGVVRLCL